MSDGRDDRGRFTTGNVIAIGKPAHAGKSYVKDLCWESINKIALAVFAMPEPEMKLWFESNKHLLSLAEVKYIEAAQLNLSVIEALLDRIVGRMLKIDSGVTERDPVIERLYSLAPGNVKKEIDRLIKVREIAQNEQRSIEQAKPNRD